MRKKTIIHFIQELGRGGAEIMLLQSIKELPEYNNIVLTMYGGNPFGDELQCDKFITMNLRSLFSIPVAIIKLRRIIKENNVDLVHTHLFWPTVTARMATPKKIPLLTTIHTSVATALDYTHSHIRLTDKITYRLRRNIIIAVSKQALKEYFSFLKLTPFKAYLLYTFVDIKRFNLDQVEKKKPGEKFLIVSVGALRTGKNFEFLIKAFTKLKSPDIELHIYGKGPLGNQLKKMIEDSGVNIILKGEVENIDELLPNYNLYVSASAFEGFSLSILEAMAMKLPLLLSDIASFREQCEDTAIYFNLKDNNEFIQKLNDLIADPEKRNIIAEKAQNTFVFCVIFMDKCDCGVALIPRFQFLI